MPRTIGRAPRVLTKGSLAVGLVLAFCTYATGGLVADWLVNAGADSAQEASNV